MPTYLIYKPFGMLSQFSREQEGQVTLADLDFKFPKDVYPVGRLDADSEGLLLLSSDKTLNARLLQPGSHVAKTYWVQVEGAPCDADLDPLRTGLAININGKAYNTLPAKARLLPGDPGLPERIPPIRVRKSIPDTWLEITLEEGKNRQVRKMCAAIGFPVLRLVRVAIGACYWGKAPVGEMQPGNVKILNELC